MGSTQCTISCASTHTVHMALVGYFIVFSFVTKPGQTLEFLLWGTIVPLNSLVGYHCSIVASTPQPMAYASITMHRSSASFLQAEVENSSPSSISGFAIIDSFRICFVFAIAEGSHTQWGGSTWRIYWKPLWWQKRVEIYTTDM